VQWKERMQRVKTEGVRLKEEEKKVDTPETSLNPTPYALRLDREQKKELQRLQKQFSKLEEEINQLNANKTNLEAELAKPENYSDKNKFLQLEKDYNIIRQKITSANLNYEQLFEKIMELEGG